MLDVQRERFKHLLANAILELWKKETGSVSSILIEGTICITAGSGKTTVVQVSDRYLGGIPDLSCNEDSGVGADLTRSFSFSSKGGPRHHSTGKLPDHPLGFLSAKPEYHASPSALAAAAYLDHLSSPSFIAQSFPVPRSTDRSRDESKREQEQPMEMSTTVCPGTGYYTCTASPPAGADKHSDSSDTDDDDDDDCDSDMEDVVVASKPCSTSTPKVSSYKAEREKFRGLVTESPVLKKEDEVVKKSEEDEERGKEVKEGSNDALDLSRSRTDADLALSSPQSYTAQVRDVIRQRLLASKGVSEPPSMKPGSGASSPSPDVERPRPLTPPAYMLSSFSHPHKRSFSHSWPGARDNPSYPSHLFSPGGRLPPPASSFSSPLTIGLPNGPSLGTHSPGILPGLFALPPRGQSFPGSIGPLHDMLSLGSKPPLPSPSQASSSGSPDDTANPVFPSPSPTSPDPTDVNGNTTMTEKDPLTGEQKVYKCEFCNKTFLFKSKYHEHLPVHTNARPFQCHMCSRTYKYKYDLRVHLRTHMGIPTKSTVCPFCSSKFSTNKILRIHIKDAHRDRQRSVEEPTSASTADTKPLPTATV